MYNPFSISKDDLHIIRNSFVNSESYGSRCRTRVIGHNTYTVPIRGKIVNVTQIKWPVLKNDINVHYKRH